MPARRLWVGDPSLAGANPRFLARARVLVLEFVVDVADRCFLARA